MAKRSSSVRIDELLLVDHEERAIRIGIGVEVGEHHARIEPLRVRHGPFLQCVGLPVENDADPRGAADGRSVLEQELHLVASALQIGDRRIPGDVDLLREQEFKRRLPDEIDILRAELAIPNRDRAAIRDNLELRGRVMRSRLGGGRSGGFGALVGVATGRAGVGGGSARNGLFGGAVRTGGVGRAA